MKFRYEIHVYRQGTGAKQMKHVKLNAAVMTLYLIYIHHLLTTNMNLNLIKAPIFIVTSYLLVSLARIGWYDSFR